MDSKQSLSLSSPKSTNNDEKDDQVTFGAAGVDVISKVITDVYPEQKNHLQATALVKFWLGGPDPLDYISMLYHPGDETLAIPAHWHYVSFGFSDLHGDNRVHEYKGPGEQSGFGFELTFRLKKEPGEKRAPTWPASLMNSLARYVFQTGNILNCGDHIPYNKSLDGSAQSVIQHMLVTKDPTLKSLETPYGSLQFRQLIGVTEEEMKAAQRWKGSCVVGLIAKEIRAGGPYFVTNMKRRKSLFELQPQFRRLVAESIEKEGSNLGHVTAACLWEDASESKENNAYLGNQSVPSGVRNDEGEEERSLDCVHIKCDLDAAELLPLITKGRLMKGRYFVFQNMPGQVIIFIPPEFRAEMVIVNAQCPLRVQGKALQIFCSKQAQAQMAREFQALENPSELKNRLPKIFKLVHPDITISVLPKGQVITE